MHRLFPLILFLLAACAPPAVSPPLPEPTADMEEALLDRLELNARAFSSLEGIAKVKIVSSGRSMGATQVLFAEKPARLRAETLSPFGQPMLLMATNGEELTVMVPSEGTFYRDRATARNLQRFTRVPLRLDDLVQILLYQVPVIGYEERRLAVEDDRYLLTLFNDGRRLRQEMRFDRRLNLLETIYFAADEPQLEIRFADFSGGEEGFPRQIGLLMPVQGAEVFLDFSEIRTNVAIPDERFLLEPPPGVSISPIP